MQIPLADAIQELRDELREAILEGKDKDIVFTPNGIDIELGVSFSAEAKAGGGDCVGRGPQHHGTRPRAESGGPRHCAHLSNPNAGFC